MPVARHHRFERFRPDGFVVRLIVISGVALALRVLYVLAFSDHLHFGLDAVWYELVGGTVAHGPGFVDPSKYYGHGVAVATGFRPPLYPIFLAVTNRTVGGSRTTYQLAGCVVGSVTVGLIGLLGRRVAGETVGLVAAALAAVSPALLGIDASVMAETIYVPLVVLTLLAVYRAIYHPTPGRWALAGALGGAAALARGDGTLIVACVVVPLAFLKSPPRTRARVGSVAAVVLAALVVVGPWVVRNQVEFGRPTLATLDVGTAVAGANCASTYRGSRLGSWDEACTRVVGQDTRSEIDMTDELQRRGAHYVKGHLTRVPLVVGARVARQWGLWNPVSEARLEAEESRNARWQLISWAFDTALLGLAVYVVVISPRRAALLPLLLLIGAVTLDAVLVYGKQRFQAAAHPAMLVLAAIALVHLARARAGSGAPPERADART